MKALHRPESAVGQILTVHPPTRKIEVGLLDGSTVQVAVIETGAFFRWPVQGENWRICRRGHTWYLDSQIQPKIDSPQPLEDLLPGHAKINADVIKTASGKQLATLDDIPVDDDPSIVNPTWQTYLPEWTNVIVGSDTTNTGQYYLTGELVFWIAHLVLGAEDTPITGSVTVTLPPILQDTSSGSVFNAEAKYLVGSTAYPGHGSTVTGGLTSLLRVESIGASYVENAPLDSTVPDAWAEGDSILLNGWYRANLNE